MLPIPADVYGKEVEAKMKASELKIQGTNAATAQQQANTAETRAESESKNQELQRQEEEAGLKERALGSLGKMGVWDRLTHPEVLKGLSQQAGIGGQSAPPGRITVISPDGKTGHIPQSQLKAALAKGYKLQ